LATQLLHFRFSAYSTILFDVRWSPSYKYWTKNRQQFRDITESQLYFSKRRLAPRLSENGWEKSFFFCFFFYVRNIAHNGTTERKVNDFWSEYFIYSDCYVYW